MIGYCVFLLDGQCHQPQLSIYSSEICKCYKSGFTFPECWLLNICQSTCSPQTLACTIVPWQVDKNADSWRPLTFIYLFREREAETQAEGEAGTMQRPRCETQSQVSRITPWAAAGAKPLRHWGCPLDIF